MLASSLPAFMILQILDLQYYYDGEFDEQGLLEPVADDRLYYPMVHTCSDDDDCFYYHSWRNNVVIAFGTLSSFLT